MRSLRASILLAAVVAAIPPTTLWGQAAEFHSRQWGVDFNIGNGFVGAGLIHFRSPTQAMVLDLYGNVSSATATGTSTSGNTSQLNLSLGARRYHPFAPRLEFHRTFGIEGFYAHRFIGGGVGNTTNTWGAGLFGELGAGWLVTPHLAVGAAWRLSADYAHSKQTAGLVIGTTNGFALTLGQVRLTGQLYF